MPRTHEDDTRLTVELVIAFAFAVLAYVAYVIWELWGIAELFQLGWLLLTSW